MSSSSPLPGPPPLGQPSGPPGPGGGQSQGPPGQGPPPPRPPDPSNSSYFFGFVITFIVLLLLFIGCGVGSWRRFQQLARTTQWDLQRPRKRRRPQRPVFFDTWTRRTQTPIDKAKSTWTRVQPISVAFTWSRPALRALSQPKPDASSSQEPDVHVGGRLGPLMSFWRPRVVPPRPPPVERPPPEAIQVAVMIAMPSRWPVEKDGRYVGHAGDEYQIGIVRIPWPSLGDGT